METPKVTDREKEMYGEDAARYTSGYNSYMKEKENAETPQQLETIEKRFKQFEDTFDSKAITVALRLMDESREKKNKGGFPDLTGDGEVTQADILKGRGVFRKGGASK